MKLFDDEFNNQSIGWVYYESLVASLFGLLYDHENVSGVERFKCK